MAAGLKQDFIERFEHAIRETGFGAFNARQAAVLVFDANRYTDSLAAAAAVLDARERERAARFKFEADRATYTVAHAAWRVAIGLCLGMPAKKIPLTFTPEGQPRLYGHALSTSLSHSRSMVALAMCHAETIGVDIETVPLKVNLEELMPTFCTPQEITAIEALPSYDRAHELLRLWTRKEALLKAFGVGLLNDPAKTPAPAHELLWPPAGAVPYPACHVRNIETGELWLGALATPGMVADMVLHTL
ncbi:4'-phosphopantetheinyl transferase family protein [Luteibacter aegosomatissinici]|uniref:4'-phosphopantetheinyl transferase family protein n=1 Tax=Luteibacter aegosomatissinici TaxID=2911539 RepID=UPI001FFAA4CA|nr:4'-phosphopantetheinyl transferase superfamily protein [Luteibacter aegosomatissinici]UPG96438.1 4'-phosphopantetheinyl transferase superfamily protein [Luteibacter aegosomatissinici]